MAGARDHHFSRTLRIISTIVLAFFLWTFGGLFDIAWAVKNSDELLAASDKQRQVAKSQGSSLQSPTTNPQPPREKRPEEKFGKDMDDIEKILKDDKTDHETKRQGIKSKKAEIDADDIEIRKQFKETEEKIKHLPGEIWKRHQDFVKKYDDNLSELRTNLDDIDKAKTQKDKDLAHKKAKDFLEKVKPPKKHQKLDPNKLPHDTPEIKELPIQERQDAKTANSLLADDKPIQLATIGSTDGLVASSSVGTRTAQALPASADLAETIEIQFTPEISAKAAELGNNPVKIYEFVRNSITYEPYYGSLKGAQQTLMELAGNDFDQMSLLVALLRVSNIPALYVYGTVEIPIEDVKSWIGIDDTNMALTALASAGIPLTAISEGGVIVLVRMEHAWCQAFVPYVQTKGSMSGDGDMWVDLDPSLKNLAKEINQDITLPGFDQAAYLQTVAQNDPIDAYDKNLQTYLDIVMPDKITSAIKLQKEIEPLWLEELLGTLPYDVIASTTFSDIPAGYRYSVSFSIANDESGIVSSPVTFTSTTPELAGKRISLYYSPATSADNDLISNYGGMYNVPAYLLRLVPEIRLDGAVKVTGAPTGLGSNNYFKMSLKSPHGRVDSVDNIVTAGGYYVPVINLQQVPEHQVLVRTNDFRKLGQIMQSGGQVALDDYAGEILHMVGLAYFQKLNASVREAEQILKIVDLKGISEAVVSIDASIDYVFDTPIKVSLSGMGLDVDRNIHLGIPIDGNMQKRKEFMTLSGMASSFYEHKIFEDIFSTESVSAIRIIQIADEREIPVYTINGGNILAYIDNLQVSGAIKMDVVNAVNAGKEVIIPQRELQINDWFGTGYIVTNPQTGAAAYMISGGLAGAALAVWSLNLVNGIMSCGADPAFADTVESKLTPIYVNFPGKDDEYFTSDDKKYPLVDLMRVPKDERYNYRDPHPDRGDSGLIKIDATNQDDYITYFLQLKSFASKVGKDPNMQRAPYLRLHEALIFALQIIAWNTAATKVIINHGYRTDDHYRDILRQYNYDNNRVGQSSYHMDGLAADIKVEINGKTTADIDVYNRLKETAVGLLTNYGGVKCYQSNPQDRFIHVDIRGNGGIKIGCK